MPKNLFSPQQLQQIEQAVKHAESISGGEIVPVFVKQSSTYEIALWRSGFATSVLAGIILVILYFSNDTILFLPPYFWSLIPITAGLLGALGVILFPALRRMVIGKTLMQAKVEAKAKCLFFDHNVSLTDQRSGILLMISFFERKAIVLSDVGIAELVEPQVWEGIINELTQGIRKGELTQSIGDAILKCGNVVAESGLQRGDNGKNELSDTVIIES